MGILSFYGISTGDCVCFKIGRDIFSDSFSSLFEAFRKHNTLTVPSIVPTIFVLECSTSQVITQCATIRNTIQYHRLKIPTISTVLYLPTTGTTTGTVFITTNL